MSAIERGLGRGLDALFRNVTAEEPSSGKQETFAAAPRATTTLPLAALTPCKSQPRKHFDEAALDQLAASIRSQGVIQPLLVRPLRSETATVYEIVAGERRWRAAQKAGLTEVPVYLREMSDEDALTAALIENLQREDLNPLEEALAIQSLRERLPLSQEDLARRLGKSRSAVANALRLLQLPRPMQEALKDGLFTPGHARAVLALPERALQDVLFAAIMERHLSRPRRRGRRYPLETSRPFAVGSARVAHYAPPPACAEAAVHQARHPPASGGGESESLHFG
ncbi:MAG: ParB/RepB/Spo0J family partition protein [Bilophila sp.]